MERRRSTFANVVSLVALMVALAGTGTVAYAHGLIGPGDIKNNAVRSKHIKNNNLKSKDIKNGQVKARDLGRRAVTSPKLARRAKGLALAAGTVDLGNNLQGSFNRLGGAITMTHSGTGEYQINVPGASFDGGWQEAIVAFAPGVSGYCFLNQAAGSVLTVQCRDLAGNSDEQMFKFVLYQEDSGSAGGRVSPRPADAG